METLLEGGLEMNIASFNILFIETHGKTAHKETTQPKEKISCIHLTQLPFVEGRHQQYLHTAMLL